MYTAPSFDCGRRLERLGQFLADGFVPHLMPSLQSGSPRRRDIEPFGDEGTAMAIMPPSNLNHPFWPGANRQDPCLYRFGACAGLNRTDFLSARQNPTVTNFLRHVQHH
jgi:hypothetical protein